jgi:hypothetical protein
MDLLGSNDVEVTIQMISRYGTLLSPVNGTGYELALNIGLALLVSALYSLRTYVHRWGEQGVYSLGDTVCDVLLESSGTVADFMTNVVRSPCRQAFGASVRSLSSPPVYKLWVRRLGRVAVVYACTIGATSVTTWLGMPIGTAITYNDLPGISVTRKVPTTAPSSSRISSYGKSVVLKDASGSAVLMRTITMNVNRENLFGGQLEGAEAYRNFVNCSIQSEKRISCYIKEGPQSWSFKIRFDVHSVGQIHPEYLNLTGLVGSSAHAGLDIAGISSVFEALGYENHSTIPTQGAVVVVNGKGSPMALRREVKDSNLTDGVLAWYLHSLDITIGGEHTRMYTDRGSGDNYPADSRGLLAIDNSSRITLGWTAVAVLVCQVIAGILCWTELVRPRLSGEVVAMMSIAGVDCSSDLLSVEDRTLEVAIEAYPESACGRFALGQVDRDFNEYVATSDRLSVRNREDAADFFERNRMESIRGVQRQHEAGPCRKRRRRSSTYSR